MAAPAAPSAPPVAPSVPVFSQWEIIRDKRAGCPYCHSQVVRNVVCDNSCHTLTCACGVEYHYLGAQSERGHDPCCGEEGEGWEVEEP